MKVTEAFSISEPESAENHGPAQPDAPAAVTETADGSTTKVAPTWRSTRYPPGGTLTPSAPRLKIVCTSPGLTSPSTPTR